MAARAPRAYRPCRLDRPWCGDPTGPQYRARRGGRRRRDRDQGRSRLQHRRRKSGARHQAAVSGTGRRPAGGAGVVAMGPRDTASRFARLPQARYRGLSRKIRGRSRFRPRTPQASRRRIVSDMLIEGGRALLGTEMADASLRIAGREIAAVSTDHGHSSLNIDAGGLLVLPGIVDLHGDAFERQMMPRPGVDFPIDVALADSDRQAISNGITTVFHATTWSWEPGLRSADNARELLEAIETLRPPLSPDTPFPLPQETYNLDAETEIMEWLAEGRRDLLAFNEHMDSTIASLAKPQKRSRMVERTGL